VFDVRGVPNRRRRCFPARHRATHDAFFVSLLLSPMNRCIFADSIRCATRTPIRSGVNSLHEHTQLEMVCHIRRNKTRHIQ
jgi:hypothetical protein